MKNERIDLDPNMLLGLSQVAKVSSTPAAPDELGRVLSKIGENVGNGAGGGSPSTSIARLLSKIGEQTGST